jgi:hypothetical protein
MIELTDADAADIDHSLRYMAGLYGITIAPSVTGHWTLTYTPSDGPPRYAWVHVYTTRKGRYRLDAWHGNWIYRLRTAPGFRGDLICGLRDFAGDLQALLGQDPDR